MGYRGKVREQEEARRLRAEGMTMPAIAERLGVARSSVSLWTRDVPFTPGPDWRRRPPRGGRRPNVLQRRKQEEIERLMAEGRQRVGSLSEREFLVSGAMLYAGEGTKADGSVKLANSDPRMIAFFCAWLRRFFTVDETRLRVRLYLHQGLDLTESQRFWSTLTRIPLAQFGAAYRAVPDVGVRHSKHVHGCPSVSYACSRTHRAVMGLVHGLLEADLPG